jgi:hypothetical protein
VINPWTGSFTIFPVLDMKSKGKQDFSRKRKNGQR